jgi:hypothetical protein
MKMSLRALAQVNVALGPKIFQPKILENLACLATLVAQVHVRQSQKYLCYNQR